MTPDREIPESDVSHFDVKIPETKGAGESQHRPALQEEGGKEREVKSFHLRQSHCPLLTKARVQFAARVAKMPSWASELPPPKGATGKSAASRAIDHKRFAPRGFVASFNVIACKDP